MQPIFQFYLCSPLSNELLHNSQLLVATSLESAGIVEDISLMIGEHKFILDVVLAALTQKSGTENAKHNLKCNSRP